jgi:hypothetical protein
MARYARGRMWGVCGMVVARKTRGEEAMARGVVSKSHHLGLPFRLGQARSMLEAFLLKGLPHTEELAR